MRRAVVSILSALSLAVGALPIAAQPIAEPAAEFTRVIVELDPRGASPRSVATEALARFGGRPGLVFEHAVQGFVAELPQAAITALSRNPNIVRITPDRIVVEVTQQETPTGYDRTEADLLSRPPGALTTVDCPAGEVCTDADIAVLDTGVNDHPDLNVSGRADCTGIIIPGFGSCADQAGFDGHGHGTHVAGIAAARDNAIGVIGIAPGARIHSVKVLGDDGTGFLGAIIGGIDWVTARAGVIDVVNMSLSGEFNDATLNTAIANSVAAGITYAVAAGNSAQDAALESPADHPDVITVSAVSDADGAASGLSGFRCRDGETDDTLATFSNFGEVVDIAAPGTCILSTYNDGGYDIKSGTSMAAPQVAGAAALHVAINGRDANDDGQINKLDSDFVKTTLISGALPQTHECGIDPASDPDAFPEPMLFLNGTAFDGSSECHQTAVDPTPPTASALTATADGYPIQLDWSASSDAESGILEYRLYRDTVPTSGEQLIARPRHDETSFTDRATTPGTSYVYEIEAVNLQFGVSARSNQAQATASSDDPTDAGWWALDDGSGVSAADSTAWRRSAGLVDGPTWEPFGKVGGALTLDGIDDRLDLDPAVLDGAGDVSFAVWLKTTKTGTQTLISGANAANDNEFTLQLVNDVKLRFYTGYSSTTGVQWDMESVADGDWHHLVVLRNDTLDQVWAYRDGVSLGGWGLTIPMEPLDIEGLVVGQDQDGVLTGFQSAEAIAGDVDEVRAFTRLLTLAEIEALSLRDLTPPTAPGQLTAQASGPNLDLVWEPASDPDSGISSYEIRRDDGAGATKQLLDSVPGTQTSYRDVTARSGVTYTYAVNAVNGGGLAGPPSPDASGAAGSADPSLTGWWALDESTGSTAADWSPTGADGDLSGSPVWDDGRFGGALTFDGGSDLVSLGHTALHNVDDVTVSAWVRTSFTTGVEAVISGANDGNDAEYEWFLVYNPDLRLRLYTGETSGTYVWWPLPTAADGEWHHIAAVRDGSGDQARLFFDGVDQGTRTSTFNPLTIDQGGLILGQDQDSVGGGYDPAQAFTGSIDDVRIYQRLLAGTEVRDLAGLGVAGPDQTAPAAPTGLAATPGDSQVTLVWDANTEPDLASYTLHRSTVDAGPYTPLATNLTTPTYLDTTVSNDVTYYYVVTATDTTNNTSNYSTQTSATPTDQTAPAAPTGLAATPGDSQVTLVWDANTEPDLASYTLHRSTVDAGPYTPLATNLTTPTYLDTTVSNDVTYYYVVTATDTTNNTSNYSTQTSATPTDQTAPAAPTGLAATPGDSQVTLVWDANTEPDLASYTLHRSTVDAGPYTPLATNLTTPTYLDTTVNNDVTYYYVVTATDTTNNTSNYSTQTSATPTDQTAPAAPTGLAATPGDSQVTLVWDANTEPDLASYTLHRSTVDAGPYTPLATNLTTPTYLDTTVNNDVTYYYVVTATDTTNNTSNYSTQTSATPAAEVEIVANSELTVTGSITSNDLTATFADDGIFEELTEQHNGGRPSLRVSDLDHRWTFEVGSPTMITLLIDASWPANPDDEEFEFEYSTDGTNFELLAGVTGADDGTQEIGFPGGVSGTVTIRVVDTDETPGNASLDSVFVDLLVLRTATGAPGTPTVSIVATDGTASEHQSDPGEFTLTRSTTSGSLTVGVSVGGSATEGDDYIEIGTTVSFADGEAAVTIPVLPIDDTDTEGLEDVTLTLLAGAGYEVGVLAADTVVIADDDQLATDEFPITESTESGVATGDLTYVTASDDTYEIITEEPFAGGKRSRLEHVWTFDVTGGSSVTLHVEAFGSGSEGFVFAYSVDGFNWVDLFSITNGTDPDSTVSSALPVGTAGAVYVRVLDTDRSKGDAILDSISVDTIFIRSE